MRRPRLNDRQRIEAMLPARCMWKIASALLPHETDPEDRDLLQRILAAFVLHVDDVLEDLPDSERRKLAKRLQRAVDIVLGRFEDRALPTALHTVKILIQDLLNTGAWTFEDGGPFDLAYGALITRVMGREENVRDIDGVETSATKNARKIRAALVEAGYYPNLASHGAAA